MKAAIFADLEKYLRKAKPVLAQMVELVGRRDFNACRRVEFEGLIQPVGGSCYDLNTAFELARTAIENYFKEGFGTVEFNYIDTQGDLKPYDALDGWIMEKGNSFRAYVEGRRIEINAKKSEKTIATCIDGTLKDAYSDLEQNLNKRFPELRVREVVPGEEKVVSCGSLTLIKA